MLEIADKNLDSAAASVKCFFVCFYFNFVFEYVCTKENKCFYLTLSFILIVFLFFHMYYYFLTFSFFKACECGMCFVG